MTDNLLNKCVISKKYGKGVIKSLIYRRYYVAVEFDNFMNGHDCNGLCKYGYGWYCFILPKERAIDSWRSSDCDYRGAIIPSDWVIYITDNEEWD